jgi:septum site-determining protein MinC
MLNDRINIKGTSNGLVITMGSGVWQGLLEELDQSLAGKASFFKGGRVALHVGPRQLTRPQLEAVGQILNRHHVTLWAVESEASGTQEAAAQLGLETTINPPAAPLTADDVTDAQGDSIVIQRTLRSGQVIDFPGNVVIIGDVNPGAEIRAGGSIIVWGRLRGIVHAGADMERAQTSVVCALQLSPMQLRIGDKITRAPALDEAEIVPEIAYIQDEQIVAEPWPG